MQQVFLQSATAYSITKGDSLLFQSATAFFLQSATSVFTKCERYYEVRQFYFNVRQVLQSATEQPILGDPGAASQDDRMFVVKDHTVRSRQAVNKMNIPSSRLAAPGSPRMVLALQ